MTGLYEEADRVFDELSFQAVTYPYPLNMKALSDLEEFVKKMKEARG